jgi:type IV pilus assembly protein PilW
LSPVELMIGLVLSLALVSGMVPLMVSTQGTSRNESAQAQAQDAGRLAIELIGRELRKTGYRSDRLLSDLAVFALVAPFGAGAVVSGDSQSLTLRYQGSGDDWSKTCLGRTVAKGAMVVQTLFVEAGELRCRVRDLVSNSDQTQSLLANVEALALTYGVDNDGDSFPDQYLAASAVLDWSSVASVNIQLRTMSAEANINDSAQPYIGFDGQPVTPSDRRLRRSFSTVAALRNRLP